MPNNFTNAQRQATLAQWGSDIETWWNIDWKIVVSKDNYTLATYGIGFDVTFDGYDNGQGGKTWDAELVTVHPGAGPTDSRNFFLQDTAQTIAHEFGHMLGLYDEYWTGAVNPATQLTDGTSLMGAISDPQSLVPGAGLRPFYVNEFKDWLRSKDNDTADIYAALIPAPDTWLLLVIGFLTLWHLRRIRDRK